LARAGEAKVVLNQADKGILQLKDTLSSLEKQENQLSKDIEGYMHSTLARVIKHAGWLTPSIISPLAQQMQSQGSGLAKEEEQIQSDDGVEA
jgi:CII-binding regulator of phage lambda lysogenization HflD